MLSFPNAKINIGLYVTNKRKDNFHDIVSCFFPIPLKEVVEVLPASKTSFKSFGNSIPGNSEDNLCLKAYDLLRKDYNLDPIDIILEKAIPIGAGLGGGSSDASEILKLLNRLFDLKISKNKLEEYALILGSDCPFFIENKVAIAEGRGEKLKTTSLNLKNWYLVLVNPNIHVSTKEAYAGIKPEALTFDLEKTLLETPVENWEGLISNQFEGHILENYPEIKNVKETLYRQGASYASMTGSGSTVYALFREAPDLEAFNLNSSYFLWSSILP